MAERGSLFKSNSDKLEYRQFTLDNGLQVVLSRDGEDISETDNYESEENARMSACSVCVGAGSFQDPRECQGLAHFTEHMCFMGSKKYPEENEWSNFVSIHGGEENAYTEAEKTTYYFSVSPAYLEEGLDRFAQFFIAPLFDESSTAREVRAIEEEFQSVVQDDDCRQLAVLCATCDQSHSVSQFGWGNIKSLDTDIKKSGINRRQLLKDFHSRYYVSDNMKVFIFGKNLDDMERWVRKSFTDVPHSTEHEKTPIMCYVNPLEPCFGKYFHINAVNDTYAVSLWWHLPTRFANYRVKPYEFFQNLLGDEAKGTLLCWLREQGLATELEVGADPDEQNELWNSKGILWTVNIDLTEEGFKRKEEVIEKVFDYIELVRQYQGEFARIFEEQKQLYLSDYHYRSREDPLDAAPDISRDMFDFEKDHVLAGRHVIFEYDEALLVEMLDFLTVDLCRVDVLSRGKTETSQKDKWFGAQYSVEQIPEEVLERWRKATPKDNLFSMPPPNPYIPSDFDIRKEEKTDVRRLLDDEFGLVFHLLDDKFNTPKMRTYVLLEMPDCFANIQAFVASCVFGECFEQLMKDEFFPCKIAGVEISYTACRTGFFMATIGYNHHNFQIMSDLIKRFRTVQVSKSRFEVQREVGIRDLKNSLYDIEEQHSDMKKLFFKDYRFTVEEQLACLERLTYEDFLQVNQYVMKNMFLKGLVHGNATQAETTTFLQNVRDILQQETYFNGSHVDYRSIKLPNGSTTVVESKVGNPKEKNCAVTLRFEVGHSTSLTPLYCEVLVHLMFEPFFDQLRTKEQLGYHVGVCHSRTNAVSYVECHVQSSSYDPAHVRSRMEEYLQVGMTKLLEDLDDETWNSNVEALLDDKRAPPSNMGEVTSKLWSEITNFTYVWDRITRDIAALEKLEKQEIIDFYHTYIVPKSPTDLCKRWFHIQYGCDHEMPVHAQEKQFSFKLQQNNREKFLEHSETIIDDISQYRKVCSQYPQCV